MKVTGQRVARFLDRPDPAIRLALVYGQDRGLVRESAERLVKSVADDVHDPFRVAELDAATLRDDPARLADEAAAIALTGGRRVVRIKAAGDGLVTLLRGFLDDPPGDALVVAEADALTTRSSLRKLAEEHERAAAVPCYTDTPDRVEALVDEILSRDGITIEGEARTAVIDRLGSDRSVTRGEVEKLALYAGAGGRITLDDVLASVGDSAERSVDDLVLAVADGDVREVNRTLDRAFAEGAAGVTIVRAAIRHFMRLHLAAGMVRAGSTPEQAIGKLRPPVFFQVRARVTRQLQRWPAPWLAAALDRLADAEIDAKSTGMPERAAVGRVLLEIARAGARAARSRR